MIFEELQLSLAIRMQASKGPVVSDKHCSHECNPHIHMYAVETLTGEVGA